MKRILLVVIILFFGNLASAQLTLSSNPKHLILIGSKSDPIMFGDFGYMYLGNKRQNFQIKVGLKFNYQYDEPSNIENYNYYGMAGTIYFISSFYFVKPGYVLLKKENVTNTFFLIVSGLFSYSKNDLVMTINDPLLGQVQQVSADNKFYKAIELEMKWHLDLNKHLAISLGGNIGATLDNPVLFKSVYNGNFADRETYTPGMGYINNVYVMLNLGLAIKPY